MKGEIMIKPRNLITGIQNPELLPGPNGRPWDEKCQTIIYILAANPEVPRTWIAELLGMSMDELITYITCPRGAYILIETAGGRLNPVIKKLFSLNHLL